MNGDYPHPLLRDESACALAVKLAKAEEIGLRWCGMHDGRNRILTPREWHEFGRPKDGEWTLDL